MNGRFSSVKVAGCTKCSLLELLFLVIRLPAWERNPGKRLVKAPKLFLPDCGLLAHLLEWSPERLAALPGLPGAGVETFVLGELLKHLAFSERRLTLWHYRTQTDIEVDFASSKFSCDSIIGV